MRNTKITKTHIPYFLLLSLLLIVPPLQSQPSSTSQKFLDTGAKAQILILGVFHFKDAGRDGYKPEFSVDVLSDKRQAEIKEVVKLLEEFRPTRIAIEFKATKQALYDSMYNQYLEGTFELKSNEVYQLGFRLAKRLGHKKVYAVDVNSRDLFPDLNQEMYEDTVNELDNPELHTEDWNKRYKELYSADDNHKMTHTIGEHLLHINSEQRLKDGHGHYLVDTYKLGEGDNYFGPDIATQWYNRNLRIFRNIQRITESKEDRILLIIGAGHVPIIGHAADCSPEYDLIKVKEYLQTDKDQ